MQTLSVNTRNNPNENVKKNLIHNLPINQISKQEKNMLTLKPYKKLGIYQMIKIALLHNICEKKLEKNNSSKDFNYNKNLIDSRVDFISLLKLYDELDCLKLVLLEQEHIVILRELVKSVTGVMEGSGDSITNFKEIIEVCRSRRTSTDNKILALLEKSKISF